jgi:D-beta-D-heptose 7-phosphate kinase/D-beta-D-heptose 1-phosphate adenosyltransferase
MDEGKLMAILSQSDMKKVCLSLNQDGKIVVFTNGCYDLLHRGHVELLQQARKLGDCLVVGLNSDSSVEKLKGTGRPLQSEENRAAVLEALSAVDYVTIFEEETPLELICKLRPNVLVKGADYSKEEIVGGEEVNSWGGQVVRIPLIKGEATRDIIRRALALGVDKTS